MDANQLGRRNLSPDAFRWILGRRYNRTKKAKGAPVGNQNRAIQIGQIDPFENTAAKLAKEHGVSEPTIKRAAKKVEAGKETGRGNKKVLSQNDKTFSELKHDTRKEIAKAANTSAGMVGMAEVVRKQAPALWGKAKHDEVTVSAAYKTISES